MKTGIKKQFIRSALVAGFGVMLTGQVLAQTFTTLRSFAFSDGANPYAALILSGNTLYGTASAGANSGGFNGNGTLFAINTAGMGFTNLYNFTTDGSPNYTNSDGSVPFAGLILSGDTLYGTAYEGGLSGAGTVFAVNTNGTNFTTLHSFTDGNDGGYPDVGLLLSGNTLYGTTSAGGMPGFGTVFAFNTTAMLFTNLYSFTNGSDGSDPNGGLILSSNTLYGTTSGGNIAYGTVFAIHTDSKSFTNLHNFTANSGFPAYTNSDGSNPDAGVILSGNTLYGTASTGGKWGYGAVFAVSTNGQSFTNLYNFTGVGDGANPRAGLILSNNTLYGTTYNGGLGSGTMFAINTNGTGFVNLHSFTSNSVFPYTNSDGAHPNAGLILSGNTLYGTAYGGGSSNDGTVFSLSLGSVSLPQLTITRSGANIILTWPTNAPGFTLQSTTNLVSAIWTNISGQYAVTNPLSGAQRFYRLSQ